ncbi:MULTISPECIES: DUF6160 family protein [Pseudomonadaceae]|uniref:DUF6160 family protein n=1 Tax=Ectopseudomonas khazarica TaxID=2502979 RepID=A0ABW7MBE8_9GAMM|nr:DUF6160 family protein [Pseudomonas sp. REST10]TNF14566.1 MAG: hypothetical protein EP327_06040 [Pseudomonadales bacterium]WFC62684.1 hypothetical protein EWH21_13465 [Pseudomonas sp. REST10]|tara:strand:+ start:27962 stop:28384 length:423 start_codon:yes stop_codon:yes gene_type:complete
MMTLKKLALAAAVMAVPFMAQADLKALDDSDLAGVTGQAGISIAGNFDATIGSIVYTDTETGVSDGSNSLSLNTVTLSGFNIDEANPLTVDVVDNKLEIGLPGINGGVAVDAVKIGNGTIGGVAINGLDMAGSTVKIWGH